MIDGVAQPGRRGRILSRLLQITHLVQAFVAYSVPVTSYHFALPVTQYRAIMIEFPGLDGILHPCTIMALARRGRKKVNVDIDSASAMPSQLGTLRLNHREAWRWQVYNRYIRRWTWLRGS